MMLEDVRDLLVSRGVTVPIQGGTMGNDPDTLIGLYDTSAFEPIRVMGSIVMESRNLQVITRDPDPVAAEVLANQLFDLLDMFVGPINGTVYHSILGRSVPISIGTDENRRFKYSCNFLVRKARS